MKTRCPPVYHSNSCTSALMYVIKIPNEPNCINCHNAIVVIAWMAYCFHDFIYILNTLQVVNH